MISSFTLDLWLSCVFVFHQLLIHILIVSFNMKCDHMTAPPPAAATHGFNIQYFTCNRILLVCNPVRVSTKNFIVFKMIKIILKLNNVKFVCHHRNAATLMIITNNSYKYRPSDQINNWSVCCFYNQFITSATSAAPPVHQCVRLLSDIDRIIY